MLGVSADYLLGDFGDDARDAAHNAFHHPTTHGIDIKFPVKDPSNPNFYELKGLSHQGGTAKGRGIVCPRDGKLDCSIVDALDNSDLSGACSMNTAQLTNAISAASINLGFNLPAPSIDPKVPSQAGRMTHFLSWTCKKIAQIHMSQLDCVSNCGCQGLIQ